METAIISWGLYRDSGGLEGYRSIFAAPELAFLYVGGVRTRPRTTATPSSSKPYLDDLLTFTKFTDYSQ